MKRTSSVAFFLGAGLKEQLTYEIPGDTGRSHLHDILRGVLFCFHPGLPENEFGPKKHGKLAQFILLEVLAMPPHLTAQEEEKSLCALGPNSGVAPGTS